MSEKRRFFLRGLWRVLLAAVGLVLVVLVFNVIGYLSLRHDLLLWVDPDAVGKMVSRANDYSYVGRVVWLSGLGFMQTVLFLGTVALAGALLFLAGYAILYIGGYRNAGSKKC